ncbi:MAG: hypothetical protein C0406_04560 [Sideroxydans sp.]|nr:hypothetical protein [Sideroxydans sp.]
MDLELAKFLFQVLTFLMTGGIGIYVYLSNKDKVTNDRIGKLEEDIDTKFETYGERIAKLETNPSHADIAKVYESINALSATVNQLVGENRGQSDTLKLILNQITAKGMK